MSFTKINEADYANKGIRVKNNPLGLSVSDAQRAFDELFLDVVVPKFNELSGELDTSETNRDDEIQNIKDTKVDKIEGKGLSTNDYTNEDKAEVAKIRDKANTVDVLLKANTEEFIPTGNYNPATKKYVDDAIGDAIFDAQAADMRKSVYDPQGLETDIFFYARNITDDTTGKVYKMGIDNGILYFEYDNGEV